jgi:hypothetical protein
MMQCNHTSNQMRHCNLVRRVHPGWTTTIWLTTVTNKVFTTSALIWTINAMSFMNLQMMMRFLRVTNRIKFNKSLHKEIQLVTSHHRRWPPLIYTKNLFCNKRRHLIWLIKPALKNKPLCKNIKSCSHWLLGLALMELRCVLTRKTLLYTKIWTSVLLSKILNLGTNSWKISN